MNNTAYPPVLKNLLKGSISLVLFTFFSTLWPLCLYDTIHHPHERIEKFHFRSNRFERLVRRRDDKLRIHYRPILDWQPNAHVKIVRSLPLLRY
mmetsp:Transcript_72277/g.83960  ORF Transcript_72277/g.83960 Transcript_72277/m.83960 type:complete len:94 (+) Transcript_72277:48-329(+)